jgi:hypothetical protein
MTIVANPRAYKIPDWFLNRQKDIKDGRYSQVRATRGTAACLRKLPASAARLSRQHHGHSTWEGRGDSRRMSSRQLQPQAAAGIVVSARTCSNMQQQRWC